MWFKKYLGKKKNKLSAHEMGEGIYNGFIGTQLDNIASYLEKDEYFTSFPTEEQTAIKIEETLFISATLIWALKNNVNEETFKNMLEGFVDSFFRHFKDTGIADDENELHKLLIQRYMDYKDSICKVVASENPLEVILIAEVFYKNALGIKPELDKLIKKTIYLISTITPVSKAVNDIICNDYEIVS